MSISAAEFEALQLQLIELKEAKYESQDREKKLLNGMSTWFLYSHSFCLLFIPQRSRFLKNMFLLWRRVTFHLKGLRHYQVWRTKVMIEVECTSLRPRRVRDEQEQRQKSSSITVRKWSTHQKSWTCKPRAQGAGTVLVIPPWLLLTTMQQEATMQMVKNLHATNKSMEEDIENHKKVELEKVLLPIPPPPKHYYWIKEMLSLFIMRLSASLTFSSLSIVIPG